MKSRLLKEEWRRKQEREFWINCENKKKVEPTLYKELFIE